MATKRKKAAEQQAQEPETIAGAVDTVIVQATEKATEQKPPEKRKIPLPDQHEPYTGGELQVLPDGTIARLRDYGNVDGQLVHYELPEGVTAPPPGVTEPLKERTHGHTGFGYGKPNKPPKTWHKHLRGDGLDPGEERADGYRRFHKSTDTYAEAVTEDKEGPAEDGQAR